MASRATAELQDKAPVEADLYETIYLMDHIHLASSHKPMFWTSPALREHIRIPSYRSASTAHQLTDLLTKMGGKSATVPHDYIYGLLGMVDAWTLPAHLAPDYTLPHAHVFADYARYLVARTGDLRLLMDRVRYPKPLANNDDDGALPMPSWVPNPATYSADLASEPEPRTRHLGGFSADGRVLKARGARVGTVLWHRPVDAEAEEEEVDAGRALRDCYRVLELTAGICQRPVDELAREWLEGLIRKQLKSSPGIVWEFFEKYPSVGDFVALAEGGFAVSGEGGDDDADGYYFATQVVTVVSFFDYVLLSDGRLAILHRCWGDQVKPGSKTTVWALKGSTRLSVLEEREDGESYRYIGWLDMEVQLDEDFFLAREVTDVHLV